MKKEDEDALIRSIRLGEFHLFERLIAEYQNPLFAFIYNIVKNADDSRDLCQETFFKAYTNLSSYKGKAKFSTWLFQIGYFKALNFLKRKKRRREILKDFTPVTQENKLARSLEAKEMSQKIGEIMLGIHYKHRTALHLFYREEKSYAEIAEIMKTPLNSVKSYIFRGKEEIRKKLNETQRMGCQVN